MLPDSATNESNLCRYGLFKQATVGPVNSIKAIQYQKYPLYSLFIIIK
jgi:hypothetical protein